MLNGADFQAFTFGDQNLEGDLHTSKITLIPRISNVKASIRMPKAKLLHVPSRLQLLQGFTHTHIKQKLTRQLPESTLYSMSKGPHSYTFQPDEATASGTK